MLSEVAMKNSTAQNLSMLMLELTAKLNESVTLVRDTCDEEEFIHYRKVVATIMGNILIDVLNPIYEEFPELKPPELR